MAEIFTQLDTAADCGESLMCSGAGGLATTTQTANATVGGTAGSTELTVTHSADVLDRACIMFQVQIIDILWDLGNWTVRLDVTTANTLYTVQEVHLCRTNASCVNQNSIGSLLTIGETLSSGVHSWTVNQGSDEVAITSDDCYIIIVCDVGGAHGNESVGITPSQDIDSPNIMPMGASRRVEGEGGLAGSKGRLVSGRLVA